MFACLNQFSAASIRLGFATFTFPALCLAYLGQGAALIHDPEGVIQSPFYASSAPALMRPRL